MACSTVHGLSASVKVRIREGTTIAELANSAMVVLMPETGGALFPLPLSSLEALVERAHAA